jgi:hypothetical protein
LTLRATRSHKSKPEEARTFSAVSTEAPAAVSGFVNWTISEFTDDPAQTSLRFNVHPSIDDVWPLLEREIRRLYTNWKRRSVKVERV